MAKLLDLDEPVLRVAVVEESLDSQDLLLVEALIHVFIYWEIPWNLHLSSFSVTHSNNIIEFTALYYKRICRYNETHSSSITHERHRHKPPPAEGELPISTKCGFQ
jgi:hypothetical protein